MGRHRRRVGAGRRTGVTGTAVVAVVFGWLFAVCVLCRQEWRQ